MVVYKASLNWFQMGLKEKTKKKKKQLKGHKNCIYHEHTYLEEERPIVISD